MKLQVDIVKQYLGFSLRVKFNVTEGVLGILGASGSGKSMTLRCIAGLETPDSGKIILNGRVLFDSEKYINIPSRNRKIGFVFQNYALFPHLTVAENIAFGLRGLSKYEIQQRVAAKLAMIRLEELGSRYPQQLSGGQQQRVALARVLVTEPEALLLDEPFSALDNYLKGHMQNEVKELLEDYHGVALFVTHNLEEAYQLCNNLVVLAEGREAAQGDKTEIFRSPENVVIAKLTGCKNISRLKRINKSEIFATDWGCPLTVKQRVSSELNYVGIRESAIRLLKELPQELENIYLCQITQVTEGVYSTTAMVQVHNNSSKCHLLQVEVNNEAWRQLYTGNKLYVQFPKESLFLMK